MIIPFIGVFISLTIWGTFLPVPGISTPNGRLVKRISSAIEVTAMAKGIHDLAEMVVTVSAHTHRAPSQSAHEPEPPIDIISPDVITTTQTRALSVVVPLHGDPDPDLSEEDRQVCIPPPGFFIPGHYRSMTPCFVCGLLTVAKVLAILWFLYEIVALMVSMAWALLRDMYGLIFEIVSQVNGPHPHPRPAVVDSPAGLYEETDALLDGSGSGSAGGACCFPFQDAVPPAQGTVVVEGQQTTVEEQRMRARSCETETETAKAILCPGHQRAPVSSAAREETALDSSEDEVRSVADADLDAASAWAPPYLPARHWALVVRRLENVSPFFFLQFFWVLFAINQTWEQPSQQHQQQQSNEESRRAVAETSGERRRRKRKRKRPSQAKRRRYARRRQREQQEGDEREVTVGSW